MTKLKALTGKQLRAFIAVLVAVCIVVPSVFGLLHVKAGSDSVKVRKDNAYVETEKTATPIDTDEDGVPDKYHIKLTAYNTAYSILGEPTDTMLVLERSSEMNNVLYERDKTNLQTYTVFSEDTLKSNNDMFDDMNHLNEYLSIFGNEIKFSISNKYQDNKYVVDPNNDSVYVYLCQTYQTTNDSTLIPPVVKFTNHYTYTIVDSQGNVYESQELTESLAETILRMGLSNFVSQLDHIDFTWQKNIMHPEYTTYQDYVNGTGLTDTKETYTVNKVYTRNDDNATNATLWQKQQDEGPLWIKDNDGNWLKVKIEKQGTYNTKYGDYTPYYVYYAFDENDDMSDNSTALYSAVYGNPYYGSEQSVFQGFKVYNADGSVNYEESLLHKSLYSSKDEEVTRLTAMKESTEEFILDLYKNAHDSDIPDGQQRVGIVSFASKTELFNSEDESRLEYELQDVKDEKTAYNMIGTIYNFEGSGRRRVDRGLELAYDELNAHGDPNHKTNVVTFTCGNPSSETNNEYETIIADAALAEKQIIDNWSNDATFYSIGLYEGADADQLYGDYFRRTLHKPIVCDGTTGSFWGGTPLASWTNPEMTEADVAATNRFLNYLSSNYTGNFSTSKYTGNAIQKLLYNLNKGYNIGIDGQKWIFLSWLQYGITTGGNGYEVVHQTPDGAWSNEGYYNAATNGAELEQAFQNVADQIVVPMSYLDENTTLEDYCSDYFQIIPGTAEAYTVDRNDDPVTYDGTLNVTETDNGVTVSGFNYSENYIDSNHDGKKLVVEFDAEPIDGFLGGNQVPTNDGDSAIYDPNGTLVENFERPKVDITPKTAMEVSDQYIYYTNEVDLKDLFTVTDEVDGLRNDFVDLIYTVYDEDNNEVFSYYIEAGRTEEDAWYSIDGEDKAVQYPQLKENTTYHVTCTSAPIYTGTETEQADTEDATVYVYKPVLSLKDTTEDYADAVAGVDLNDNIFDVTWEAEGTDHAPTGTEPTLEYTFYNKDDNDSLVNDPDDHSMSETTNYQVDVTIKGHEFSYTTNMPYYVKTDGTYVLVSEYTGDKSDLQPETYIEYDSSGNPTEKIVYELDENGNETNVPVYKMVVMPTEVSDDKPDVTDSDNDQHFTTYKNFGMDGQEDENTDKTVNRTEGNFTIYVGTPYDLNLQKLFEGPYAAPEGVRFTLTGSDGTTQIIDFATSEFTGQTSTVKQATNSLRTGVTYTLVETFLDANTDGSKYDTTATEAIDSAAATDLADMDPDDDIKNFQFSVPTSEEPDEVTIVVTNTDETEPPPLTEVAEDNTSAAPYIALAVLILSGAGTGIWLVYRKDHAEA